MISPIMPLLMMECIYIVISITRVVKFKYNLTVTPCIRTCLTEQVVIFFGIKIANFCQQVLEPLGCYMLFFTASLLGPSRCLFAPCVKVLKSSHRSHKMSEVCVITPIFQHGGVILTSTVLQLQYIILLNSLEWSNTESANFSENCAESHDCGTWGNIFSIVQ